MNWLFIFFLGLGATGSGVSLYGATGRLVARPPTSKLIARNETGRVIANH
jgi:hypothetical protein